MSDLLKMDFDKRAATIKSLVSANKGEMPEQISAEQPTLTAKNVREAILLDVPAMVKQMDALRKGSKDRRAIDISLAQFVKDKLGFSPSNSGVADSFFAALNIDPSGATIESLMTMPEVPDGYRWIVPEVIREAVRLGLRKTPIYNNLIAAEETVTQPSVILPFINLSNGKVRKVGEAETLPTGNVSFGQKTVTLQKVATGIKISDEVLKYVSLNLLSIYLQDVGVNLGIGLDVMALDTLVNGDQAGNADNCGIIGVDAGSALSYKDMVRAWLRMGGLGKLPNAIIASEDAALSVLMLNEFKALAGKATLQTINVRTPIPTSQDLYMHGYMPAGKIMLVDTTSALIKLNASALTVESERIAERQISGTYVSLTTGFASLFRDARLMIDPAQSFGSQGFPTWMNLPAYQNQPIS